MPNEKSIKPTETFIQWYGTLTMEENEERIAKRYSLVTSFAKKLSTEFLESTLSVIFDSKRSNADLEFIKNQFQNFDSLFVMHSDKREIEVLSAITLAIAMQGLNKNNNNNALKTALSIATTSMGRKRKTIALPMSLNEISNLTLTNLALETSQRKTLKKQPQRDGKKISEINKRLKELEADGENGFQLVAQAIDELVALISDQQKLSDYIEQTSLRLEKADQELNILWWLFGEETVSTQENFSSIDKQTKPLLLALEAAQLTKFPPGPSSIGAIFSKAGITSETTELKKSIESFPDSLIANCFAPRVEPSPLRMPIHFALYCLSEFGKENWIKPWSAKTEVNENVSLENSTLATQFYREILLKRLDSL